MGHTDNSGSEPDDHASSGLTGKVIYPVIVAVLAAVIIALLTGGFGKAKEWVFPTKVTVTGTVVSPVPGVVKLTLDGHPVDSPNGQGGFNINGVGEGTHYLGLRELGTLPLKPHQFKVGKNDKNLGQISLEPLVKVGFIHNEGRPALPSFKEPYTAYVWLHGGSRAESQVESVLYDLPVWIGKSQQPGPPPWHFCYAVKGQVDAQVVGQYSEEPVTATVKLRDGRRFQIQSSWPFPGDAEALRADCGVTVGSSTGGIKRLVPNVIGQSLQPATLRLRHGGFNVSYVRVASQQLQGTVIRENPGQDSMQPKGTTIKLTVSKGQTGSSHRIKVPKVVGISLAMATAILQAARFKVVHIQVNSTKPAGVVVTQTPAAGTSVAKGSTVSLKISKGPTETTATVPDVVGYPSQQAVSILEAAGFQVNQQYVSTDASQENIVQSQNPAGNSQAAEGSTVTITIGQHAP